MTHDREERLGQSHDPCKGKKEKDSGDHGQTETDDPGLPLFPLRKFPGQDRDKDDVVDAENDFERR